MPRRGEGKEVFDVGCSGLITKSYTTADGRDATHIRGRGLFGDGQLFSGTDLVAKAVYSGREVRWVWGLILKEKKKESKNFAFLFLLLSGRESAISSCVHRGADCTQLLLLKNPPVPLFF